MGFDFEYIFKMKCCSCNKETDLVKSTNFNIETNINNDANREENIKEGKSKVNNSNGYSRNKFKDSVFQCPQQNNDNDNAYNLNV